MGRIGKFEYPDLRFGEAIAKAEQVHSDYNDKTSASNLATIFGISARGGAFPLKVKDMKMYGLIEGERDGYKLSVLALRIVQDQSDFESRADAFLNVPLFKAMHEHFAGNLPDNMDVFKNRLKDIVKPAPDYAVSIRAARLKNRYNEALPFLRGSSSKTERPIASKSDPGAHGPITSNILTVPPEYETLVTKNFIVGTRRDLESVQHLEDQVKVWIRHLKTQLGGKNTA